MKSYYRKIKGWFFTKRLYRQQVRHASDGAVFVELGAYMGKSTACMAVTIKNSGKQIRFDSYDLFAGDTGSKASKKKVLKAGKDGIAVPDIEAICRKNLEPVSDVVNIIKGDAIEAAANYDDESVDFLFIDDYHEREHTYKELVAWWPKIKPGGVMAGDDYKYGSKRDTRGCAGEVPSALKRFIKGTDLKLIKPWDHGIKKCWRINKPL